MSVALPKETITYRGGVSRPSRQRPVASSRTYLSSAVIRRPVSPLLRASLARGRGVVTGRRSRGAVGRRETAVEALARGRHVAEEPGRGEARPVRGGERVDWAELTHGTKRRIADGILRAEVLRLEREVRASDDWGNRHSGSKGEPDVADAIAELIA